MFTFPVTTDVMMKCHLMSALENCPALGQSFSTARYCTTTGANQKV